MVNDKKEMLLIINAGSSSIKFSLYKTGDGALDLMSSGQFSGFGGVVAFKAKTSAGTVQCEQQLPGLLHAQAIDMLLKWTEATYPEYLLTSAGHRVVHGGERYSAPIVIDDAVLAEIRRLIPLAPLHQPHHVSAIEALKNLYPELVQVACFDTAFHHANPKVATTFAIPRALTEEGVRRYGFHGLSYEYIASAMASHMESTLAQGRVVIAHLGAGASMCALNNGRSVTSTMGFTALDGLMMNKRCGSIDPGVILYLIQEKKMNAEQISQFLYNECGLKGVSGFSDDMKVLVASDDPRAKEAVDLFVYRISRELGSLAAALGGLDALVFTAGIGEHAAEIRRRVCDAAAWLGVQIDQNRNAEMNSSADGYCISSKDAGVPVWIIPTNEDLMIAQHTQRLLSAS